MVLWCELRMVSWIINCEPFSLCGIEQVFVRGNSTSEAKVRPLPEYLVARFGR